MCGYMVCMCVLFVRVCVMCACGVCTCVFGVWVCGVCVCVCVCAHEDRVRESLKSVEYLSRGIYSKDQIHSKVLSKNNLVSFCEVCLCSPLRILLSQRME